MHGSRRRHSLVSRSSLLPTRRAMRVDPTVALKCD